MRACHLSVKFNQQHIITNNLVAYQLNKIYVLIKYFKNKLLTRWSNTLLYHNMTKSPNYINIEIQLEHAWLPER